LFHHCAQWIVSPGYRLRKHIGKALQKRSSAIRTALDRYNAAALALNPPRPTLQWEEVVEYAFLSDFDLLRDARQEIQHRPWATPAGRLAMDTYFKVQRAREEIARLNIEIRRLATHLHDEDNHLRAHEGNIRAANPALAHQIHVHRMLRGRFKAHHEFCLRGIAKIREFSGTIAPGEGISNDNDTCGFTASAAAPPNIDTDRDFSTDAAGIEAERVELGQEAEDEDEDEAFSRDLLDILTVSTDSVNLPA
jgi:hypothetical protein